MKRNIRVCLGKEETVIGTFRYNSEGARESAIFEYDSSWLSSRSNPNNFAIEPNLPLVSGPQFHRKNKDGSIFHGAIADTEPDGWGRKVILRDHAKRRKESLKHKTPFDNRPLNELDFLLAVDDFSRVGALRFQDENGIFRRAPNQEENKDKRTAPPLIELKFLLAASRAVEENTETAADLLYLQGRGTSLGGMRPKCTLIDNDGHLSIGKFPSIRDERPVTKGEVLALQLARDAGINAAKAKIVDSDGIPVALIRRFDRASSGERLMYISAATLLGVEANSSEQHTYTEIVDAIRIHGANVQEDIAELWRRISFSILITNTDDHLLNHGFLHTHHGKWQLSPAFDINPSPERVRELKTWISEETGPESSIEALLSVAPYFRINNFQVKKILSEVNKAIRAWRKKGRTLGMSEAELDMFEPAFEHSERVAVESIIKMKSKMKSKSDKG
ncbi:MAG: type II toxin-antitoxin system HipA family toxin [Oligoflexia bacterium]|nr:type II toxin-antitoxin system HipA family toxin [Oligoflexia bacterium]